MDMNKSHFREEDSKFSCNGLMQMRRLECFSYFSVQQLMEEDIHILQF